MPPRLCYLRKRSNTFANCIGVCRCLPGYVISDNCRHTFANCIGVCRCLPGYVISENGRRCLQAATEFTDPCDESILAPIFEINFSKFLKKNLAATEFTDPCDELAQCSTYLSGSFCQNNICTCNPGS
ncbi:hypothetical protein QE152_g41305, partial [Popillia japonica]